jgi:chromosome segregation ATPase
MPTAGKVLAVLVLLVVPIWIVLISGVAELNKSGGSQVASLKKQVEQLDADLAKMEKDLAGLKDNITNEQRAMTEQLAVIRSHQADLQKARSEMIEYATRAKLQLASMQEAAKQAEAVRELRTNEKTQEIAAKAAAEAEVEKLKQDHAELVDQLDKLRNEFKATVDSNRRLLGRLKSARSS